MGRRAEDLPEGKGRKEEKKPEGDERNQITARKSRARGSNIGYFLLRAS